MTFGLLVIKDEHKRNVQKLIVLSFAEPLLLIIHSIFFNCLVKIASIQLNWLTPFPPDLHFFFRQKVNGLLRVMKLSNSFVGVVETYQKSRKFDKKIPEKMKIIACIVSAFKTD